MSRARFVLAIGFAITLCACASRLQNDVYFDPEASFASSQSLGFTEGRGGTDANRGIARREIQTLLEAKGFRFSGEGRADLLVRYDMGTRAKVKLSGSSTHGDNAGIVIEMMDPVDRRTVWHGLAYETWYDSMDPATEIRKAVKSVLAHFPPTQ